MHALSFIPHNSRRPRCAPRFSEVCSNAYIWSYTAQFGSPHSNHTKTHNTKSPYIISSKPARRCIAARCCRCRRRQSKMPSSIYLTSSGVSVAKPALASGEMACGRVGGRRHETICVCKGVGLVLLGERSRGLCTSMSTNHDTRASNQHHRRTRTLSPR